MRHPYADFLRDVEKPSRYVGGEYQEVRKDPARVAARVCLVFPDVYEIGMSHLGTKILYGVLNKRRDIACERAFAPWLDCEAELRARGLPLVTLESAAPLRGVRRHRVLAAVRADVHQRAQRAGPGRAPAARAPTAATMRAADHRGRADRDPPRAAGAVHRRVLHRRGGGAAAARWCCEAAALRARGRAAARAADPAGGGYPLYVPELYATEVDAETGFVVVGAPRRSARAGAAQAASGSRTSTASRSPTTRRCRTPRRSSIAWRSRSRAAAPRAAASARPG